MRGDELAPYLDGDRLWGDDFDDAGLAAWYRDEKEGYAARGARDRSQYRYGYHALNERLGYQHLPPGPYGDVLGLGSAYGDEFLPIARSIQRLTIVEPSAALRADQVGGVPVRYVEPGVRGRLPLPSNAFDVATCFDVLHHIPNVSEVVDELARCLRPGGYLLLREPIVSMGDWRGPRRGLTPRERGIPLELLRGIVRESGLQVRAETLYGFPLTSRVVRVLGIDAPYAHDMAVAADVAVSRLFRWNINYHPRRTYQRFRPTSVFHVLVKGACSGS